LVDMGNLPGKSMANNDRLCPSKLTVRP